VGIAMFYHLTRSSPQDTLAMILPRALAAGWRVMLRGTDRAALEQLDLALWTTTDDSFLPHGLQGGPHDADQPILLGSGAIANDAQALVLLDAADTTPTEAAPLHRLWVIFDAADQTALTAARALWTKLTTAGQHAQYWSEESGRWAMKTEKNAPPKA
jgi:DNA polymerase-3 subunit chi